ncbi:MAG: hypothetical protein V7K61_24910 [Nostoc sp.]
MRNPRGVGGVGGWGRSLTPHTPHTPHTPLPLKPTLCVRNPGLRVFLMGLFVFKVILYKIATLNLHKPST